MANICDNKFYICSDNEDTIKSVINKFETLFEDVFEGSIDYEDSNVIEGWFSSKWDFPMSIFQNFFEEYDDDSIYMRCLSEEYGCQYVAMNVYSDGAWWSEQTFAF